MKLILLLIIIPLILAAKIPAEPGYLNFSKIYAGADSLDALQNSSAAGGTLIYQAGDTVITADTLFTVPSDTSAPADTAAVLEGITALLDTLIPLKTDPLFFNSSFISSDLIRRYYSSYAADNINLFFEPSFIESRGWIGQPEQLFIYGAGFGGVSYMQDGILLNSRLSNVYDINLLQSGFIDSIEVIPSPRGFLYSVFNNSASVNFITKNIVSAVPYTRIKYYEGPFGEAAVDGIFNAAVRSDLTVSADISTRGTGLRFVNSEFNLWQAKTKLNYYLSNEVNIIGSYDFVRRTAGFNGGVAVEQINPAEAEFGLYNYLTAPVINSTRFLATKQHLFNIKLLSKPVKFNTTAVDVFYRFNQDEVGEAPEGIWQTGITYKEKSAGASVKHDFLYKAVSLNLLGNYEFNDQFLYRYGNITGIKNHYYSAAAVGTLSFLDSTIIPSAYYKYSGFINGGELKNFHGMGFDMNIRYNKQIRFYAGYSVYENSSFGQNTTSFETGVYYTGEGLNANLLLFNRKSGGGASLFRRFIIYPEEDYNIYVPGSLWGAGAGLTFRLGSFMFAGSGSAYTQPGEKVYDLPEFTLSGGLFFNDNLFRGNLDLVTGFKIDYNHSRRLYLHPDDDAQRYYPNPLNRTYKIDFIFSGEIQKKAVAYITIENLLGTDYYIVPFYPMPGRSFRFGILWDLLN